MRHILIAMLALSGGQARAYHNDYISADEAASIMSRARAEVDNARDDARREMEQRKQRDSMVTDTVYKIEHPKLGDTYQ